MKTGSYYAAYVIRKLWSLLAILLVTVAVLMSLLRYSLPYMDGQKHHLEQWLFEEYGAELKIGYVSAMWKGKGPAIVLKDLSLAKNENSPIEFNIDETQIELNFWSSITSWQIQSRRFNLIGMDMSVDLPAIQNSGEEFPIVEALQTLFLEQLQRFSVSNSEVLLKTRLDEQQIQIQQLSWINQEERHQGVGEMRVAELARNSARFVMDLTGGVQDLRGTFYAEGQDLDLSPWLKQFMPSDYSLEKSRANFQVWAGLENSRISSVQAHLSESRFAWQGESADSLVTANLMKGQFFALPSGLEWNFYLDELMLLVNDQAVESNWSGHLSESGVLSVNQRGRISVAPVLPLLSVLLGEEPAKPILELNPSLAIDGFNLEVDGETVNAQVDFSQLSFDEQQIIPGMNELYGSFYWADEQGYLQLMSGEGVIQSKNLLGYILPYQEMLLQLHIDGSGEGVELFAPKIRVTSPLLTTEHSVRYSTSNNQLAILGSINGMTADNAKLLFPEPLMGSDTSAYLRKGLHEGHVDNLNLLWFGNIDRFPYEKNEGVFQATIGVSDGVLEFDEEWPALNDLNADLLFENYGLTIDSRSAKMQDVAIQNVQAVIPDLSGDSVLEINAQSILDAQLATKILQQSSIQDSVGEALEVVKVFDQLDAKLNLVIPLSEGDVLATGEVKLSGNNVSIPDLDIKLANATGTLRFENEILQVEGLTADLLGQQISIDVDGNDSSDGYQVALTAMGDWEAKLLLEQHHPMLTPFFEGQSSWQADLSLTLPEEGYNYNLQILSRLEGLDIALPAPLNKPADEARLLLLDSEGDQQASTVRLLMGSDIKFNGILPHNDSQFSRAHLTLGEDNFVGMGLGFSVSLDLDSLEFSPWYHFIDALVSGMPASEKPLLEAPQRIFVETDTLLLAGQQIQDVEVLAKHRENDWLLEVNSEQARAKVNLSKDWLKDGVAINADFINLTTENSEETAEVRKLKFEQLPPLNFKCKQCQFNDFKLGAIDFVMSKNSQGMHIDNFEIRNPDGTLKAQGDWVIGEDQDLTKLTGEFKSNDFGAFLKDFDYDSGIRDSDAEMKFSLSWNDSPYGFEFASLNGVLDWELGDGYLSEIEDKGARIFSILSLESLVRKLALDFRDVFAKGFFYNKIDGSFTVENGKVYTEDTVIDGGPARVALQGYTDLSDQQINYNVAVQPNLTKSLPVLLAWMVNPATAVAALALDEVITSADVVSGIQYSLTGTISEPQLIELDRASRSVELPAKNDNRPQNSPTPVENSGEIPDSPIPEIDDTHG